jgi:hypothetical protein
MVGQILVREVKRRVVRALRLRLGSAAPKRNESKGYVKIDATVD